ncbi:HAD-IA family hydrolase [Gilvimarinus polysaccharolyticus]|uniref:HAD-IA family hydrolase n=1 Tax=Gilvimarinus polysaccharolyticus TaxID=863921 RepID=UPI0006739882|nr:HAD-IA family hydrolase [Gilvimarinus polysaccharolyticus]
MYDQYQAIIFDMDGTLIDSGQLHEVAWIETLNKFSIPIDRPFMRSLAGVPTKGTVEILLKQFDCLTMASVDAISDFKEVIVRDKVNQYVKPTALVQLAEHYYGKKPMCIGTGSGTDEAKSIIEQCQISYLIDHVVGADLVSAPKPAPDTFLLCAELMDVAPEHCVVFEDAKLGFEAARHAGMAVVDVLDVFGIENDYFL